MSDDLPAAHPPISSAPAVTELAVTAIKGFRLIHPTSVTLTAGGALGDRDFLMVDPANRLISVMASGAFLPYWSRFDAASGVLVIGRDSAPELAGPVELGEPVQAHLFGDRYVSAARVAGPWDEFLSRIAGVPVRLLKADEPSSAFDVHPVTLVSEASVAALGQEGDASPVDRRRFRMLLTCDSVEAFAEDSWAGHQVAVGSAVLRMGGPVSRCAAIQRHPDHPDRKLDTLRRIARLRGLQPSESGRTLNLGVYASVLRAGTVSVGDRLRINQPE